MHLAILRLWWCLFHNPMSRKSRLIFFIINWKKIYEFSNRGQLRIYITIDAGSGQWVSEDACMYCTCMLLINNNKKNCHSFWTTVEKSFGGTRYNLTVYLLVYSTLWNIIVPPPSYPGHEETGGIPETGRRTRTRVCGSAILKSRYCLWYFVLLP